ncbi:transcriptional regulator [Hapalosiphon sp. MRB220]|nr:transcriptional regulator [Hapalosiphon sp. MRB220]
MNKPIILVTGATGKTGSAVVFELVNLGWPVRAVVHTLDGRSERLKKYGVEVVAADLFDPEQLFRAMQGTSRAYYCPPFNSYMIQSATAFMVTAQKARLEAIVGLSQWLASPSHPSLLTRQHWLIDQMFSMIPGVAYTIVNPGFFADNYLRLINFAAHFGLFPNLTGNSRNAPPSNEDIARVVVAALIDPVKHGGKTYRPTGPVLLSVNDMTKILSRVLKRKVLPMNMPMSMFLKAARAEGVSAFELSSFRYYVEDHKRGAFEMGAPTSDVYDLTGRQPEDFESIARRYAALPFARISLQNKLRALVDFIRIGFTPAYNLDRYEREQRHPLLAHPILAADSEIWVNEHGVKDGADRFSFQAINDIDGARV